MGAPMMLVTIGGLRVWRGPEGSGGPLMMSCWGRQRGAEGDVTAVPNGATVTAPLAARCDTYSSPAG